LRNLTEKIIGCAIIVHKELGPGLLESVYERCLALELIEHGFNIEQQQKIPVIYKDLLIDTGCRADIVVENLVVLEIKSVKFIDSIHRAQLMTYMKLGYFKTGLLINFNSLLLKKGLKRIVL
jgi:GxxExxY protein